MNKKQETAPQSRRDMCAYYDYDEETEQYVCEIDLDEDEMQSFLSYSTQNCPYFRFYEEYKMVERQN